MKTNSPYAWFLAARPKTLTGAAVPVMVGVAMAFHETSGYGVRWQPALLCLLFAFIMQIDANFVNDYFDCKHGNDDETRLGPKRACSEGWITLPAMLKGIIYTTLSACIVGLPLIYYGGIEMVFVGIACVIFCFLYTTVFSYLGLGDILVLVFFGIVPVCATGYLCIAPSVAPHISLMDIQVFLISLSCGIVIDTLLVVNNYRDIDNDIKAGKTTIIVRIGKRNGRLLYLSCGIAGAILASCVLWHEFSIEIATIGFILLMPYVILHISTYIKMKRIGEGRELNLILGQTARNMFVYGITLSLSIIVCTILS